MDAAIECGRRKGEVPDIVRTPRRMTRVLQVGVEYSEANTRDTQRIVCPHWYLFACREAPAMQSIVG